ncbi:hypothetical protein [Salininema proteolyticum]|uniref:Uncharacterized protein n=1 Tax=Salininema proteolyticum TaxID=1607685 RepID=A0ABV8TWX1_9ACTN
MTDTLAPGRPAAAAKFSPTATVLFIAAWAWLIWTLVATGNTLSMDGRLDDTGIVLLVTNLLAPMLAATWAGAATAFLIRGWNGPRLLSLLIGGLLVGILCWVAAFAYFAADPAISTILGALLLACSLAGGLLVFPENTVKIRAAMLAMAILATMILLQGFLRPMTARFFDNPLDNLRAWSMWMPLIIGLVIGIAVFLYLRKVQPQTTLYGYVYAAAFPGVLWIVASVVFQISIGPLTGQLQGGLNPLDAANLSITSTGAYNGAMTVLFTAAVTTLLAYGLLIPRGKAAAEG